MSILYHIIHSQDWLDAQPGGVYAPPSLQTEGFIHFSTAAQVADTANRYYQGQTDLLLLVVDPAREVDDGLVKPVIRYEPGGTGELYPHIYGVLELAAVLQVIPFPPGPDGRFSYPGADIPSPQPGTVSP